MRWLKEFFRPSLKCERIGHKDGVERVRRTFRSPKHWGIHAFDRCEERRLICPRCREPLSEWEIVSREGIHSVAMLSDMDDELKKNGVVEL